MSNRTNIYRYEIGTTIELHHDEKEQLVAFLTDLSRRRDALAGRIAVSAPAHGGFVLNKIGMHILDNVSTERVREAADNYETSPRDRVVGFIEAVI